jgi:hypothetical protein
VLYIDSPWLTVFCIAGGTRWPLAAPWGEWRHLPFSTLNRPAAGIAASRTVGGRIPSLNDTSKNYIAFNVPAIPV